jgi:F420-non-reducing hydrogenase small subunit
VVDQGAKLISAIGALIDTDDPEQIETIMDSLVDVVGYCYRFGLADSVLNELKYK